MLGCIRPARWCGSARLGSDWLGSVRLGAAQLGAARLGSARCCLVWLGSARLKIIATQGIAHLWTQIVAVLEAAAIHTSSRISKFQLCAVFFLKINDCKNLRVLAMPAPEMMPSRRRQKSTHFSGFQNFNFVHVFFLINDCKNL